MALDEGGWSIPRPGRLTPGNAPVPNVQEAGWAPGPFWTGTENLAPTGIRSPDRPASSESLYRLSYRGPRKILYIILIKVAFKTQQYTPNYEGRSEIIWTGAAVSAYNMLWHRANYRGTVRS